MLFRSVVQYSNGKEIGRYGDQNRTIVPLAKIPMHLRQAVMAAEDRNFYNNRAFSITGLTRAVIDNITSLGRGGGGSTITQQYAKTAFLSPERSIQRKIKELVIAIKLENQLSKDQILENYLNTIYFGRGAYGVETAANQYFNRSVGELTIPQSAVLASILRSPGYYDPSYSADNKKRLEERFNYVLDGMVKSKWLTPERRAKMKMPQVRERVTIGSLSGPKGYLMQHVQSEMRALGFNDDQLMKGGLIVKTTLDEKAQQEIEEKKRKPSKDIRVEAARQMVMFTQTTPLGTQGQVVLIYPADRMNTVTANTLLKTLEEPPGSTRFVLSTDAAHLLLPTIRSRCQSHALETPSTEEAQTWLMEQGVPVDEVQTLWRASGGRPSWVLDRFQQDGVTAALWSGWPRLIAKGLPGLLEKLSATEGLACLQKLCHDLMAVSVGAPPQFFRPEDLPKTPSATKAALWSKELKDLTRHVEHPFNASLQMQAWTVRARLAMRPD